MSQMRLGSESKSDPDNVTKAEGAGYQTQVRDPPGSPSQVVLASR